MFTPNTEYDFRIKSYDNSSHIIFSLIEYMNQRLPSLSCIVEIFDNHFTGYRSEVWFSLSDLNSFIYDLELLEKKRQVKACLGAMTYEDFNITIECYNKKGDIVIYYSMSDYNHNDELSIKTT